MAKKSKHMDQHKALRAKPVHIESMIQEKVVELWRHSTKDHLQELLHSIPNGGYRSGREASTLVAEGVVAGTPDLFLNVASMGYNGFYLEMKKPSGTVSDEQRVVLPKLAKQGYLVGVFDTVSTAYLALAQYMNPGMFSYHEPYFLSIEGYKHFWEHLKFIERGVGIKHPKAYPTKNSRYLYENIPYRFKQQKIILDLTANLPEVIKRPDLMADLDGYIAKKEIGIPC